MQTSACLGSIDNPLVFNTPFLANLKSNGCTTASQQCHSGRGNHWNWVKSYQRDSGQVTLTIKKSVRSKAKETRTLVKNLKAQGK